jgi:hypothetical protein
MITARFDSTRWRKGSRSTNAGNCVEVNAGAHTVGVRDSKNPGAVLIFNRPEWTFFLSRQQ